MAIYSGAATCSHYLVEESSQRLAGWGGLGAYIPMIPSNKSEQRQRVLQAESICGGTYRNMVLKEV